MAIIIHCKKCNKRSSGAADKCPHCSSTELRFIIDYYPRGRNGKRIFRPLPETVTDRREAREIEHLIRQTARGKIKPAVNALNVATVDKLFPEYLNWYKLHRAPTTYRDISLIHRAHFSELLGQEKPANIGTEQYDYYQKMRSIKRVSNRTINKELNYFSGFLKWCRIHKKIEIPPIQYEKLPYRRPTPVILSFSEMFSLLDAAEDEPFYRALILCLYSLGLRYSEASFLKLQDFDFANQSVKMIQKGGTEKILPLNKLLIKAVRQLVKLKNLQPESYLFENPSTGKPILDIRCALERLCQKAGITKKVNPHLFRHTWATHMLGEGVDLRIIQRFLGHAQISTTEIYTHVVLGNLRDASNAVLDKMTTKTDDNLVIYPHRQDTNI